MKTEDLNKIYDELNQISVQIEPRSIPNPRYISEKIGECHVCIERVEKLYIQANKELSVYQIALNNATSAFEIARDNLIANDQDIASLPSAKDRESTANTRLKNQINEINFYKQSLQSSETLVKTLTMKLKNLTRLNGDIRLQMKIMESQIRLGTGDINDPTTKNLMDELKKTVLGKDVWEGAETKGYKESIVDPSRPIEEKDLVTDVDPLTAFEETVEKMILTPDPIPEIDNPVIQEETTDMMLEADPIINISAPYTESIKPMVFNNPTEQKPKVTEQTAPNFDDLLAGFESPKTVSAPVNNVSQQPITPNFDDLLAGLDSSKTTPAPVNNVSQQPTAPNFDDLLAGFISTPTSPTNNVSQPSEPINNVSQPENPDETEFTSSSVPFLSGDGIDELEPIGNNAENKITSPIDLDEILNISNLKPGGVKEPKKEEPIKIKESEPKKTQVEQNSDESLFNSLLSQFK